MFNSEIAIDWLDKIKFRAVRQSSIKSIIFSDRLLIKLKLLSSSSN